MALANYSDLKTAIGEWRFDEGSDLSPFYDDFIDLAEDWINNGNDAPGHPELNTPALRVREMETSGSLTLTNGAATLPTDYLEWRSVVATSSPRRTLSFGEPGWFNAYYPTSYAGSASHFSVVGGSVLVRPTTSSDIEFNYYQKIPPLSDANTTNWLLTKSPRVYLFGTVMAASIFRGDTERAQEMAVLFRGALKGLTGSDKGGRWARAVMRVSGPTP